MTPLRADPATFRPAQISRGRSLRKSPCPRHQCRVLMRVLIVDVQCCPAPSTDLSKPLTTCENVDSCELVWNRCQSLGVKGSQVQILSARQCDVSRHGRQRTCDFAGPFVWSGWSSGGLVVASGVDGQVAEEFSGGGVDDSDVEVLDEERDVGSGVGSPDADVALVAVASRSPRLGSR